MDYSATPQAQHPQMQQSTPAATQAPQQQQAMQHIAQQGLQPQMQVMPQPPKQLAAQPPVARQAQYQQAVTQVPQQPPPVQHHGERPNFQMALLPPPQDRLYNDFSDLLADLRNFARMQGYAVVIESSVNRDPSGKYRRYNLSCSKGGKGYQRKSTGQRQSKSHKTGCPMKLKAVQERAFPCKRLPRLIYNDKWHIVVQCAQHNHEPFTGEPGASVPPQFRKIEADGQRWLMIMHRDAQLTMRQLTIGLRISFGDKYQYVKKSDIRNQLAKIRREEERKAAVQQAELGLPPGATYTLLPPSHAPPPPDQDDQIPQIQSLPPDMQVPDPDLESDDEDDDDNL
ncbi:hypothetical protein GQ53DRAFT_836169 [Thozetella sp. PMI_491]|nr:hypothetical protein GQ53DRAFT_836169 [Thozetella sp. PMI_491]